MSDKNRKTFEAIFTKTRIYLVVIAVVLIILCIQNINFIIPSILLYGILLVYTFWNNNKNKTELDRHIQELTFNVDTIAKNALINSPFPLVIADEDRRTYVEKCKLCYRIWKYRHEKQLGRNDKRSYNRNAK
ncbi:MAG: hypothetical protein HFJ24_00735 [Clostridia bacterium]|nr:hypothetical protein [Clostridia bacterium]MCI9274604.1 hypothetical protein [Clostridia bacterium]